MKETTKPSALASLISAALPSSAPPLQIHHVWHSPSKSDALYSPPKGTAPESTTLSSHFLAVSLPSPKPLLVFGIEVLIYSTATRTTLFVSKADSTGFLSTTISKDGKRPPTSIVRTVTTSFMKYLVDKAVKKSENKTTHISLFARAQDQYLFPASIKNSGKHVLSDRQLIKWWARCLDPLLQSFNEEADAKGYLLVPGLDKYECRALFPPGQKRWIHGHPYAPGDKAVRECIPHFPDDPKSRFMMEMEVDEGAGWRGVTMDSFWELMSFRQECSLGKSVGFLSVIVPPKATPVSQSQASAGLDSSQLSVSSSQEPSQSQRSQVEIDSQTTVTASQVSQASAKPDSSRRSNEKRSHRQMSTYTGASLLRHPERLKRLFPRHRKIRSKASKAIDDGVSQTKGGVISKKEYDRLLESLLNSDFGGRKYAEGSSRRWIEVAGSEDVIGRKEEDEAAAKQPEVNVLTIVRKRPVEDANNATTTAPAVNLLPVRKKSKISLTDGDQNGTTTTTTTTPETPAVNTLSASLVRKKPKPGDASNASAAAAVASSESSPVVNTLSASLVRKKPKQETDNPAAAPEKKAAEPAFNVLSDSLVRKKPKEVSVE